MIRPFSHPHFTRNEYATGNSGAAAAHGMPCAVCGRFVDTRKAGVLWVRIVDGGARFVGPDHPAREDLSPDERAGDLSHYPIGSACYRKHRAFFAPLVVRFDEQSPPAEIVELDA